MITKGAFLNHIVSSILVLLLCIGCINGVAEEEDQAKKDVLIAASCRGKNTIAYVSREHLLLQEGNKLKCFSAEEGKMIYEREIGLPDIKGTASLIDIGSAPCSKTIIFFQWFKCTDDNKTSYVFAYQFLDVPNNVESHGQISIEEELDMSPLDGFARKGVHHQNGKYLVIAGGVIRLIVDLENKRAHRIANNPLDGTQVILKDKLWEVSSKRVRSIWNLSEWKEPDSKDRGIDTALIFVLLEYDMYWVFSHKKGIIVLLYPKLNGGRVGGPKNVKARILFLDPEWKIRKQHFVVIRTPGEFKVVEDEVYFIEGKEANRHCLSSVKESGISQHGERRARV